MRVTSRARLRSSFISGRSAPLLAQTTIGPQLTRPFEVFVVQAKVELNLAAEFTSQRTATAAGLVHLDGGRVVPFGCGRPGMVGNWSGMGLWWQSSANRVCRWGACPPPPPPPPPPPFLPFICPYARRNAAFAAQLVLLRGRRMLIASAGLSFCRCRHHLRNLCVLFNARQLFHSLDPLPCNIPAAKAAALRCRQHDLFRRRVSTSAPVQKPASGCRAAPTAHRAT